jgi:hypothetical protein
MISATHKAFHSVARLFKAEVPPDWWQDARKLDGLLKGSWEHVSRNFSAEVRAAIQAGSFDHAEELLSQLKNLGLNMVATLGDQPEALFSALLSKATAAWTLHGKETLAIHRIKEFDGDYQKFLTDVHAEQVKRFTELNPGRILHPQIQRQIDHLRDSEGTRSIDLDLMSERLERIIKQDPYWEGLSDVHVSRLWHADGVLLADENGVTECYITGPDDKLTCPVCQRMLGQRFVVAKAKAKIEKDIGLTNPDEYVDAWKFPRIKDVDNISQEELANKGFLPPYHSRCRHDIAWFTR